VRRHCCLFPGDSLHPSAIMRRQSRLLRYFRVSISLTPGDVLIPRPMRMPRRVRGAQYGSPSSTRPGACRMVWTVRPIWRRAPCPPRSRALHARSCSHEKRISQVLADLKSWWGSVRTQVGLLLSGGERPIVVDRRRANEPPTYPSRRADRALGVSRNGACWRIPRELRDQARPR